MAFSFGQQNNNNNSNAPNKPLFGEVNSSSGAAPSIFGTANTSSGPASGSLFGGTTTGPTNAFGGGLSNTPAAKPGGLFGGGGPPTSGASSASPFGGFSGFGKPSGDAPKANPFGAGAAGGTSSGPATSSAPSFAFGTGGSTPAATPAANKTSLLPSTTPAGAPPGNSIFGQNNQAGGNAQGGLSFFPGTKPAATSSTTTNLFSTATSGSSAPKPLGSSAPGSGLFNLAAPASGGANKTATPAAAPASLFGGGTPAIGTQNAQKNPVSGLFSGFSSTTPSSTPAKPSGLNLGGSGATQSSAPQLPSLSLGGSATAPTSLATPSGNLLAQPGSNTGASSSGPASFSWSKPPTTTPANATTQAPTTTTTSGSTSYPSLPGAANPSPFPNLGGATSAPAASGVNTTSGTIPSLFSGASAQSSVAPQPASTTAGTAGAPGNEASKSGLASSTVGPAPSAQSRLKNKSMDEIITRWAADLSKYQKEFQQQAEAVTQWDRALVENSDKVRQLYSKTFQAERDAGEVERQLTMMEENQQELDSYLDRYEKEIENLMKMHGVSGKSDGLRGPDQERERTYKLAEKLQDRLNELNKDLTEMIEEINTTSQTLSKTGKPDDPLTKVVRVLNTQLAQLQVIDTGALQLQQKINQAQKESQRVGANGWNGLGSDPTDDFYKSFRGGRTERFGGVS